MMVVIEGIIIANDDRDDDRKKFKKHGNAKWRKGHEEVMTARSGARKRTKTPTTFLSR
jgi:hypothetical protein